MGGIEYSGIFPMEMLIRMIAGSSPVEGIVLDPFLGTGTTAVVAASLGRHCIGIDMSEAELDIAHRRMTSFESNGYIEKGWLNQPGGYRLEFEGGLRVQLGGTEEAYLRQSIFSPTIESNRRKVTVRKAIQKAMDFTPLWLMNEQCCDDECACVKINGCLCKHDCACPGKSLHHSLMSLSSDSLATKWGSKMYISTSSRFKEFWQEVPTQVGYEETDEPGIKEPKDTVDANAQRHFMQKGGGAAWARARRFRARE